MGKTTAGRISYHCEVKRLSNLIRDVEFTYFLPYIDFVAIQGYPCFINVSYCLFFFCNYAETVVYVEDECYYETFNQHSASMIPWYPLFEQAVITDISSESVVAGYSCTT